MCAKIDQSCVIDGNYLLSNKFRNEIKRVERVSGGIHVDSMSGANGIDSFIFGKHRRLSNFTLPSDDYVDEEDSLTGTVAEPKQVEIISFAPLFRLRYSLNISTEQFHRLSADWERKALKSLNEQFQSDLVELSCSTSSAVSDSVSQQARQEGTFIVVLFGSFFILICVLLTFQGNTRTSVGYLSLCGIINFSFSSFCTFGLLSIMNIDIIEPMALIVFSLASLRIFLLKTKTFLFYF